MVYGITLLRNRVSPRCNCADSVLFVQRHRNSVRSKKSVRVSDLNIPDLFELLIQNRADALICGGITRDSKDFLTGKNLVVIDNVACEKENILKALESGKLKQNFGFVDCFESENEKSINAKTGKGGETTTESRYTPQKGYESPDCLACSDKICLEGKTCDLVNLKLEEQPPPKVESKRMMEAALDISCERERTLCRLSELIYFCLEMQYERVGVAYCIDLEEPTEILVRVLRRFFKVYPVCCKIGGIKQSNMEPSYDKKYRNKTNHEIACNPWGQVQALNNIGTDFNIMVGLCMGADCVFLQGSTAPSTVLFVKDRSLANNPIGAVYSDYYLKEASQAQS